MHRPVRFFCVAFVTLAMLASLGCKSKRRSWKPVPSPPLQAAHAHNDYLHARPLQDAIAHRFMSVEADVHRAKEALLVAHWFWQKDPKQTLEALYLKPLMARFLKHKGSIYKQRSKFYLLIDIKTNKHWTYKLLHRTLARYKRMLTVFGRTTVKWGAVTVIVSGNRPLGLMRRQLVRYAGYDGRPGDLDQHKALPASIMPLVSQKWSKMFSWSGKGSMPPQQQQRLKSYVAKAHSQGRMVRFWATPDAQGPARDALWKALLDAKVDLINTDDLTGLQRFLLAHDSRLKQQVPRKAAKRPTKAQATKRVVPRKAPQAPRPRPTSR